MPALARQRAAYSATQTNQTVLLVAAAALVLAMIAMASSSNQDAANSMDGDWPISAPSTPSAEGFEAYNDGRAAPGEAVVGVNEISWKQGNCPDGRCPLTPAVYTPPAANYTPAPPAIYPTNYAPPVYSQPVYYESAPTYYTSSDCNCENCQCAARARFPIARASTRIFVRTVGRVATAPFRMIRNRRCGY